MRIRELKELIDRHPDALDQEVVIAIKCKELEDPYVHTSKCNISFDFGKILMIHPDVELTAEEPSGYGIIPFSSDKENK